MESEARDVLEGEGKLNVFGKPWKNSDVILVAGDEEFHVHKLILSMQSKMFEVMFNGHFKEARENRIPLVGKDPSSMYVFLRLLYPSNMLGNPLNKENIVQVLSLADEYQADNVIKQCFAETEITSDTALGILPYASKYDEAVRGKCVEVILKRVTCQILKENVSNIEPCDAKEIYTGKCEYLENLLLKAMYYLLDGLTFRSDPYGEAVCRLGHKVRLGKFRKAKKCEHCLEAFKETFCNTHNGDSQNLLELLVSIHDMFVH